MKIGKVLFSAIVGTTAMTIFSYWVSASKNRNFHEPEVLGTLIEPIPQSPSRVPSKFAGWVLDYTIGLGFVAFYHELFKRKTIAPTATAGALLGAVSGLVGVSGWKGMIESHPNPQAKKLNPFFSQLMLAHVVFGVFRALSYKAAADKPIPPHSNGSYTGNNSKKVKKNEA